MSLLAALRGHAIALVGDRSANIAISAAAALPLLVGSLALAVDYGNLTLQRREAQSQADLAAITAAADPARATQAVAEYLEANGLGYLIATDAGFLAPGGGRVATASEADGILRIETGGYDADPAKPPEARFEVGAASPDAARVHLERPGRLHFGSLFIDPPIIAVTGTAHAPAMAGFSIGSRLFSLQGGILNKVLGSLLGSEFSLKAMDYRALLDADVSLLETVDALASELDLTGVTYGEVLQGTATIGDLAAALAASTDSGPAESVLLDLAAATRSSGTRIDLAALLDAGPLANAAVGNAPGLDVRASVLDVISAAAAFSNGGKQVDMDLGGGIPGLISANVRLAIGEPPQGSSWIALGAKDAVVRTAQTRLLLNARIGGEGLLSLVELPLYVEIAHGEAKLADIACNAAGTGGAVTLRARPGIVEAAIGRVSRRDFAEFNRKPVVRPARLVDLLLAKVDATAHFEATNMNARPVRFTASDIREGRVKSVHTRNPVQSLTTSLLERLDADIDLLGLPLASPRNLQKLLARIVGGVAAPLDGLVDNVLTALGIKLGEADLRVTGIECSRTVLVQ